MTGNLAPHGLVTACGMPAKGITIPLDLGSETSHRTIAKSVTNHDGRTDIPDRRPAVGLSGPSTCKPQSPAFDQGRN